MNTSRILNLIKSIEKKPCLSGARLKGARIFIKSCHCEVVEELTHQRYFPKPIPAEVLFALSLCNLQSAVSYILNQSNKVNPDNPDRYFIVASLVALNNETLLMEYLQILHGQHKSQHRFPPTEQIKKDLKKMDSKISAYLRHQYLKTE